MNGLDSFRWEAALGTRAMGSSGARPSVRLRAHYARILEGGPVALSGILAKQGRSDVADFSDDQALLAAAALGIPAAQDEVARRLACVPRMVRLRHRQLGRALDEKLEDIVQDVVLVVWARLDRFRGSSGFEAWVWGFVLRITYRQVEIVCRRPRHADLVGAEVDLASEDDDLLQSAERALHVQRALDALDALTRRIVQRRIYLDQSFDVIANELAMPVNTIKTRYYRGLRALEAKLRPVRGELIP